MCVCIHIPPCKSLAAGIGHKLQVEHLGGDMAAMTIATKLLRCAARTGAHTQGMSATMQALQPELQSQQTRHHAVPPEQHTNTMLLAGRW